MMNSVLVFSSFSVLITFKASSGEVAPQIVTEDETVLAVKHGQDGVLMKELLSQSGQNISVINSSFSEILKKKMNYKNQLLEKILPHQLETFRHLTIQPGFRFTSREFTSSLQIDQPSFRTIQSPYFWQLAGDRTGTWFAIFDGFYPTNKTTYPRLIFSRNQFRGYELVKEPFVYSDCYNITKNVPQFRNASLQNCHVKCKMEGASHMAIGRNSMCFCGEFNRYSLLDIASCPLCEKFSPLRCPTAQHVYAGYLLQGNSVEEDIVDDTTSFEFKVIINTTRTYVWTAGQLTSSLSNSTTTTPLYITPNLFMKIQPPYPAALVQLFYSPWKDCTNYKDFKTLQSTSDLSVIIPVFCMKLTHQLPLPSTVRLKISVPTGGNFFSAQSLIISGVAKNAQTTDKTTTSLGSPTSVDATTSLDTTISSDTISLVTTNYKYNSNTKFNHLPSIEQKHPARKTFTPARVALPLRGMTTRQYKVRCKSCMCLSMYQHVSMKNLSQALTEIKENLLLPTKNLSSYIRRIMSADDNRQSAADIGYVGVAVIVSCISWIVTSDIVYLPRFIINLAQKLGSQTN